MTTSLPPSVDPKELQEVLDGRWAHVRRDARENLNDRDFLPVYGESMQDARDRVTRAAKKLADSGRVGYGFPKQYGGEDDSGGSVTSIEMLAFGDLSLMVKAGVQWGLFGGALQLLGSQRQHDKYLRDVMTFDLPGCFAMTETGHGSDVQQLRTTCTYDPETQCFDLHTPHQAARKDYIGNAAKDGRMAVVFAQLITQGKNHGVHAWLVPIRNEDGTPCPGVTIGDDGAKAGLNGVDNGRLTFDHVQVPRDMLLDRYGQVAEDGTYTSLIENETRRFFTMLGTLVRGRVSVGGSAASATKLALDIAVRYGNVRRQFAAPGEEREIVINDYLVHQRKLLPALATTYGLHFAQGRLVEDMHDIQTAVHTHGQDIDEEAQRELESRAAGLKVAQTWHATRTIQMCREACGGAGYLQENRLPHLKADTDVFTTFEGDNTVLLQLVAKGLLTGYRDTFGSLDGWGRIGFIADMVRETVLERTAARALIARLIDAVPGRDDEVPMLDRGWQLKMFEFREKHALEGAIRRLRKNSTTQGMAPFDMFNDVQDHVLKTAQSHIDRVVLEAFVAGVDRTTDPDARRLLDTLCDLYALSTIEADKAWFMEHGQLTAARAKTLTGTVNQLLKDLRPHITTLVDAFAIPAGWKAAQILEEEADRQEAMAARDAEVRSEAEGDQAPGDSATDLEVAPAQ
ncbi:acyl-CoA oxidase [Blastococcus sp. CT_GayMR20]|uniref:acyl-CoA dehydrogenase family protein n=1 Tax=Blastococcus sp. CT_GayMR20 TaxID=2559609 RepID=UPI0010736977|nr:acyl-CoA dehydrogenase [Blastococcus sp. CT_GayMR20]TFV87266.1 acyl-CoA oxidase [Blastococcus sp. CT_GayMR20]TFV87273.1 acyl-CoA oxidase [Blastococcus sp. CT_GayMR20]